MVDLREYIAEVPDFPKPGILFRDIQPLIAAPKAFRVAVEQMAEAAKQARAEMLVAVESRGFLFGAPMALHLNLPLVIARKPGKLPGDLEQVKYGLEYGKDSLEMKRGAVPRGARVSIVDDVLATGGTCLAAADLVTRVGGEVVSFNFLLELAGLHGRERLGAVRVDSLVAY